MTRDTESSPKLSPAPVFSSQPEPPFPSPLRAIHGTLSRDTETHCSGAEHAQSRYRTVHFVHDTVNMPSPTNQDHSTSLPPPTLPGSTQSTSGPSSLQHPPPPSSPGPGSGIGTVAGTQRSLRKLASAHSLAAHPAPFSGSTTNLRASTTATNPPSLIAQQRLAVRQQDQHNSHRGLPSARRHASTTFNASPQRARANSDAPVALQLNAAAAAMSSQALRNSGALAGRTLAHDALSLERLIRDGPPDGDFESALESARIKVLKQEIKSDSDGMVSCSAIVPAPCAAD